MKELTSSFDDVEKRFAIFLGLGAFLLNALVCLISNASLETYLIQGGVLAILFGVVGYFFSHWLGGMVKQHTPQETANNESVEFRRVDAEQIAEQVVSAGEIPETVIQEDGSGAADFEMENFGEAGVPVPPSPTSPTFDPGLLTKAAEDAAPQEVYHDSGDDLPPPPVPAGA